MQNPDNGRVTMAVLGEKLDNLKALVQASNEDTKEWRLRYGRRLEEVEKCIVKLQEMQSTGMKLLGGISLILSAAAAYIGSRF